MIERKAPRMRWQYIDTHSSGEDRNYLGRFRPVSLSVILIILAIGMAVIEQPLAADEFDTLRAK